MNHRQNDIEYMFCPHLDQQKIKLLKLKLKLKQKKNYT